MKKFNGIIFTFFFILVGCNSVNKSKATNNETEKSDENADLAHSSKNTLDWEGVYQGILPCADCQGIKTTITLLEPNTYRLSSEYIGESKQPFYDKGNFTWNDTGSIISIGTDNSRQYKVGENVLFHLDNEGNQITGDLADKYKLMKNYSDLELENKKWILTELMGQKVENSEGTKVAFLMFNSKQAVLGGNNGCNVFSGGYTLKPNGQLEVGNMANTLMACKDMENASKLMKVIQTADNYTVVDGILNLNKGRMATMAKFKVEEE